MQILKGKSKTVARIIGAQVLMLVFGLSVTLPTQQNTILMVGANVLSAALYFFLIYSFMQADGEKDALKSEKNPDARSKRTGLAVMLASNVHNILLLLAFSAGLLIRLVTSTSETFNAFVGITDTALHLLYGVFLGFSILLNPGGSTNPLVYTAYIVVSCAVGILGYYNGRRGFSVLKKLGLASDGKGDGTKK